MEPYYSVPKNPHDFSHAEKMIILLLTGILLTLNTYSQSFTLPSAGDGTKENPYHIVSLENLYWIASDVSHWGMHYIQTVNIDASSTSGWDEGKGWTAIGNSTNKFTGSYNGGSQTISGLFINRPDTDYQGLFGVVENATLSNLGLINVNISGKNTVGGFVAASQISVINNSYTTGTVNGNGSNGGLTGTNTNSTLTNCYSICDVTGTSGSTGGLTGNNGNSTIKACYSGGSVNGNGAVGGLVGLNIFNSNINNCYSTAAVNGNSEIGGLVGSNSNSIVNNSYSKGSVTGNTWVGGLIGSTISTVYNSFWDTETSGQPSSYGGTEKTTAEMKILSTFSDAGWDIKGLGIEGIWNIGNDRNDGYPYLNWQYPGDVGPNEPAGALVNTVKISDITENSVIVTGVITNTGNPKAGQHGVCWSTGITPTIFDNRTQHGVVTQAGNFNSQITGLVKNTTYFVRAYVTDNSGTKYGQILPFITSPLPEGSGTQEAPYKVSSLADLLRISIEDSLWTKHFIQTANIDASGTNMWNEGKGFTSIGSFTIPFTGSYNGNDHSIEEIYINRPDSDYLGLFGVTQNATISNLGLINVFISGKNRVGGLIGNIMFSVVNRCYSSGQIIGSGGGQNIGGLLGSINHSTVSNSYSQCSVSGGSYTGGLAGTSSNSTVRNSFSSGSIHGSGYVGGLIGRNVSNSNIIRCFSAGYVSGNAYIGGLTGYNYSNSTVSDSYSFCNINGNSYVGGLVGYNYLYSKVINCYSTGEVNGSSLVGGLVGSNVNSTVNNSFWNTGTSGQTTSDGGTGKTTSEMQNIASYTNTSTVGLDEAWDFLGSPNNDAGNEDYWGINPTVNNGYPYLVWQYCFSSGGESHPGTENPLNTPEVLSHPQNKVVCPLTGTSFRVDPVNPDDELSYQWEMKAPGGEWVNVSGSVFTGIKTRELVLTGITSSYNNYLFRCLLSNICSPPVISGSATLTLITAPVITTHPVGKTVCEGESTFLTVEATSHGVLEYRWKKGGNNITSWSSSPLISLEEITLSSAGDYMVAVRNICNNIEESNSASLVVNPKPVVSFESEEIHLCPGDSLVLDPGTGYSSYLWNTGATTQTIEAESEGSYHVTVTNDKNCSDQASVLIILDPDIPVPDLGNDVNICLGEAQLLDAGNEYDSYLWSTGATSSSISADTATTRIYWVEVKRNISVCVKRDTILVNVQKPYEDEEICMVLIDPDTEKNLIVWEKTEGVNTLKYEVYKMTGTTYTLVGERMFADSSWILDMNSNPSSQAEAYVLVTIDNCGNASEMSKWHKPFLLQSSPGFDVINLSWEPYLINGSELIAPGVHMFKSIAIFRGTAPSNLEQIGAVTAGIGSISYIDNTAPADIKMYYRIGGEKETPCNPNNLPLKKASAGPFVHSLSNLEDNTRITDTGHKNTPYLFSIYPNPMSEMVVVKVSKNQSWPMRLRITDLSGRVLKEQLLYENEIILYRENMKPGAYLIEITGEVWYKEILIVR